MPFFDNERLMLLYYLSSADKNGWIYSGVGSIRTSWNDFRRKAATKRIVLYGSGKMCDYFLMHYPNYYVDYIVDGKVNDDQQVEYLYNKCIYHPSHLKNDLDALVLITPTEHLHEMYMNVIEQGVAEVYSLALMEYSKPCNRFGLFWLKRNKAIQERCRMLIARRDMERSELIRLYNRSKEARVLINALINRVESLQKQVTSLNTWNRAIQKRQTERYRHLLHTDLVVNALIDSTGDEELKKEQIDYYFSNIQGNEYRVNFNNPATFNEKSLYMQIKEADNPLFARVTDKYEMRRYISETLGDDRYTIQVLGIWDEPEEIDFEKLPSQFVLKATNGGDGRRVIVVKDKTALDIKNTMNIMRGWVGKYKNLYYYSFNGAFKHVKPRIIAEEYLDADVVLDYKLWMYHGKLEIVNIGRDVFDESGIFTEVRTSFFYPDGTQIHGVRGKSHLELEVKEFDDRLDKMREMAELLAKPFDFIRVDFFVTRKSFYIAELTLTPSGGILPFDSKEMDQKIGSFW